MYKCHRSATLTANQASLLRFIRTPLTLWVKNSDRSTPVPVALVVLLDALDEADHDNRGCVPVCYFISKVRLLNHLALF